MTTSPWPYAAPAADAAAAAEPHVFVPVMLSPGGVGHYAATFDDGATWHPACGAGVELEPLERLDELARVVEPCPQCRRWAQSARRLVN